MAPTDNGWNEYSKLVLEQLETLSAGIDGLRIDMQEMRQELAVMKAKEGQVAEIKAWKDKIDEFASPRQLLCAIKEIEELKIFKTKAGAVFMAVQTMMGLALAWSQIF